VVLKERVAPEEIIEYVASRVAPFKKIRAIEVIDRIPKSPSGKILRRLLFDREAARA
jgi:acyl-coenzyme A synthetase/AMP-(fatty) acid ligase